MAVAVADSPVPICWPWYPDPLRSALPSAWIGSDELQIPSVVCASVGRCRSSCVVDIGRHFLRGNLRCCLPGCKRHQALGVAKLQTGPREAIRDFDIRKPRWRRLSTAARMHQMPASKNLLYRQLRSGPPLYLLRPWPNAPRQGAPSMRLPSLDHAAADILATWRQRWALLHQTRGQRAQQEPAAAQVWRFRLQVHRLLRPRPQGFRQSTGARDGPVDGRSSPAPTCATLSARG